MSLTAQQVFDRAVQRGSLNEATLIPTAQVVEYIASFEKQLFLDAAKLNPDYFGKTADTATRAVSSAAWDIGATPGDIAALTRVAVKTITGTVTGVSAGDEVSLISLRWPNLGFAPRAYLRGRKLTGYNNELGADDSNMVTVLTLDYAELPVGPTGLGSTLRTPDEWADVLVLPLSRLIALRDRRMDEVQLIVQEETDVRLRFFNAVGVYDGSTIRPVMEVPVATALDRQPQQQSG